jgi:hypothetical protein
MGKVVEVTRSALKGNKQSRYKLISALAFAVLGITLLAIYLPHHASFNEQVAYEESKRFAWVGGVTNSSAEFRVRLGAANAILTVSRFEDMSDATRIVELEGDWTLEDPYFTSNLTVSSLTPETQYYYELRVTAIGLLDVEPEDVDPDLISRTTSGVKRYVLASCFLLLAHSISDTLG